MILSNKAVTNNCWLHVLSLNLTCQNSLSLVYITRTSVACYNRNIDPRIHVLDTVKWSAHVLSFVGFITSSRGWQRGGDFTGNQRWQFYICAPSLTPQWIPVCLDRRWQFDICHHREVLSHFSCTNSVCKFKFWGNDISQIEHLCENVILNILEYYLL